MSGRWNIWKFLCEAVKINSTSEVAPTVHREGLWAFSGVCNMKAGVVSKPPDLSAPWQLRCETFTFLLRLTSHMLVWRGSEFKLHIRCRFLYGSENAYRKCWRLTKQQKVSRLVRGPNTCHSVSQVNHNVSSSVSKIEHSDWNLWPPMEEKLCTLKHLAFGQQRASFVQLPKIVLVSHQFESNNQEFVKKCIMKQLNLRNYLL